MSEVDVSDISKRVDELIGRVQQGEEIEIISSGQLVARLVPADQIRWKTWDEIAHIFDGPADTDWQHDVDIFDQNPVNPWERPRSID